jgi:hypothetical protein
MKYLFLKKYLLVLPTGRALVVSKALALDYKFYLILKR